MTLAYTQYMYHIHTHLMRVKRLLEVQDQICQAQNMACNCTGHFPLPLGPEGNAQYPGVELFDKNSQLE